MRNDDASDVLRSSYFPRQLVLLDAMSAVVVDGQRELRFRDGVGARASKAEEAVILHRGFPGI